MIYICIPVLDEAPTVGVLLWRIRQVMTEFRRDFHLVVLDDGSTDATAEVLAPYEKVLPLTVLRNERTTGYAAALERLLRDVVGRSTHPKRDIAVVLQADFTEPPEEIPSLVKKLEGGADVVGSAVAGVDAELPRGMRWSRRGLPWLLGRSRLPKEGGDPLSGFRAYRVHVLKRAFGDREGKPLLTRQGWAANAELLMAVAPHARRADQSPVELRYGRRQRETRFLPWPTLRETWQLVRTAPRKAILEAAPPAPAANAALGAPPRPERTASAGPSPSARPERSAGAGPSASGRPERAPGAGPSPSARPERTERPARPAASTPESQPTEAAEPREAEEGRRRSRPRRPRNRKPRPEGAQPEAEARAEPQGEAPAQDTTAESADGAEPRARRRPPRRNRKRGRREGNTPDGQGE